MILRREVALKTRGEADVPCTSHCTLTNITKRQLSIQYDKVKVTVCLTSVPLRKSRAKHMTQNRHCLGSYSAQPKRDNNSVTYWEWSTFPLEDAMNNSLLPGEEEEKKPPPGYWTKSSFLSSLGKKNVYKVLSAFCILHHWSSDNWLCLGGSLLDMVCLSSGKRYSSKLSLPSQGTVRQIHWPQRTQ